MQAQTRSTQFVRVIPTISCLSCEESTRSCHRSSCRTLPPRDSLFDRSDSLSSLRVNHILCSVWLLGEVERHTFRTSELPASYRLAPRGRERLERRRLQESPHLQRSRSYRVRPQTLSKGLYRRVAS